MKCKFSVVQDDCDVKEGNWFYVYGALEKSWCGRWNPYAVGLTRNQLIELGVSEELLNKCNREPQIVELDPDDL